MIEKIPIREVNTDCDLPRVPPELFARSPATRAGIETALIFRDEAPIDRPEVVFEFPGGFDPWPDRKPGDPSSPPLLDRPPRKGEPDKIGAKRIAERAEEKDPEKPTLTLRERMARENAERQTPPGLLRG